MLCNCTGSASRLVTELESGVGCRMGQAMRKLRQGVIHWWSSQRSGPGGERGVSGPWVLDTGVALLCIWRWHMDNCVNESSGHYSDTWVRRRLKGQPPHPSRGARPTAALRQIQMVEALRAQLMAANFLVPPDLTVHLHH